MKIRSKKMNLNMAHDVNWDICFLCSLVVTDLLLETMGFRFECCC